MMLFQQRQLLCRRPGGLERMQVQKPILRLFGHTKHGFQQSPRNAVNVGTSVCLFQKQQQQCKYMTEQHRKRQLRLYHRGSLTKLNEGKSRMATTTTKAAAESRDLKSLDLRMFDSLSKEIKIIPCRILEEAKNNNNDDDDGTISMMEKGLAWYTCGPTTYAPTHLGHARTYVWMDIIRRVVEYICIQKGASYSPLFVMNITDVDDKIIRAAAAAQQQQQQQQQQDKDTTTTTTTSMASDAIALARKFEREFWNDMDLLNCKRPHIVTRVTEHTTDTIIPYIQKLEQNNMTYTIPNDGVYFDVQAFESISNTNYGKLVDSSAPSSRSPSPSSSSSPPLPARNNSEVKIESKRDPRDFALWKNLKNEEDELHWPSPWGAGRPGWHIECSAMIEAVQQQVKETHTFVVHAGGIDLKFPHHTNEIAQAEAYHHHGNNDASCGCSTSAGCSSSSTWIPHWIHTGHLTIGDDKQKMSKSKKNFLTMDDLWFDSNSNSSNNNDDEQQQQQNNNDDDDVVRRISSTFYSPADDFRLWVLGMSGSYTNPAQYSREKISRARQHRTKIIQFLINGEDLIRNSLNSTSCSNISSTSGNNYNHDIDNSSSTSHKLLEETKRWKKEDYEFYTLVDEVYIQCIHSILDNMDGSAYVKGLLRIAEAGKEHMQQMASSSSPTEPLQMAITKLRSLLSLIGFSEWTARAGIITDESSVSSHGPNNNTGTSTTSSVIGGEAALIEEIVRFRATVRQLSLQEIKKKKKRAKRKSSVATTKTETDHDSKHSFDGDNREEEDDNLLANEILRLCDKLRDRAFPSMGVEIMDSKLTTANTSIDESISAGSDHNNWRYCLPRVVADNEGVGMDSDKNQNNDKNTTTTSNTVNEEGKNHEEVSSSSSSSCSSDNVLWLEDFFSTGIYHGRYSEYDENGIPVKDAKGEPVSSREIASLRNDVKTGEHLKDTSTTIRRRKNGTIVTKRKLLKFLRKRENLL